MLLLFIIVIIAKISEERIDITKLLEIIKNEEVKNSSSNFKNDKINELLKKAIETKEIKNYEDRY